MVAALGIETTSEAKTNAKANVFVVSRRPKDVVMAIFLRGFIILRVDNVSSLSMEDVVGIPIDFSPRIDV